MRRFALLLLGCGVLALPALANDDKVAKAEDTPNTLTDAEKNDGFKLLFDGQTTAGWRGYRKDKCPAAWQAVDGALTLKGRGGDIITEGQYESFELRLEWKISPRGNSGIFYHVHEGDEPSYATGPEIQVLDNKGHADGKNPLTTAGSCYALYAPSKDVTKPVGEWNEARVIVKGRHVEHWLNGEKIVEYEKGGDDWNAKVAASKFSKMPNFGRPTKGHICLQDHSDEVAFRNIRIKELKLE
jgi:hypothetical protein